MKSMILFMCLVFSFSVFARDLTTKQKHADLTQLANYIKAGYGPLEYKKNKYGIDVNKLLVEYKKLATKAKTNSEYYYLVVKFVAEFNDSHFGARVPTDHKGKLGFSTDYINGKVLIDTIDRKVLTEKDFPFAKGDEVISIGGKSTADILTEIYPYMGQGAKVTALRKAAQLVAFRPGSVLPVLDGKVNVEIRKGDSEFIDSVELEWKLSGTPLDEFIPTVDTNKSYITYSQVNYDSLMVDQAPIAEGSFRCSGTTRTKIPEDATIIMKKPFVAYYHKSEKGNIGYLRIPHYYPQGKNGKAEFELRFKQYEYAVSELEKNTVGLIIDQDHNCGGSVGYLHNILGLFVNKPYKGTQFELLANKQSFMDFNGWLKSADKNTLEYQALKLVAELIKTTWMDTDRFLTEKTSIMGTDTYFPHNVNYTHPIIVLIDEMSGSGGDAFPAMMQGLGRAKLLGTRTMGAGGHVVELPSLDHSQIKVRMTKSLFYHPNNVAIENNGATPDIKYTHNRDDFMYEYRGYQKFYLNELFKLIK